MPAWDGIQPVFSVLGVWDDWELLLIPPTPPACTPYLPPCATTCHHHYHLSSPCSVVLGAFQFYTHMPQDLLHVLLFYHHTPFPSSILFPGMEDATVLPHYIPLPNSTPPPPLHTIPTTTTYKAGDNFSPTTTVPRDLPALPGPPTTLPATFYTHCLFLHTATHFTDFPTTNLHTHFLCILETTVPLEGGRQTGSDSELGLDPGGEEAQSI